MTHASDANELIAANLCDEDDIRLQDHLDDLVLEAKQSEASAINNNGQEAQIIYLLAAGYTVEEIQNT